MELMIKIAELIIKNRGININSAVLALCNAELTLCPQL